MPAQHSAVDCGVSSRRGRGQSKHLIDIEYDVVSTLEHLLGSPCVVAVVSFCFALHRHRRCILLNASESCTLFPLRAHNTCAFSIHKIAALSQVSGGVSIPGNHV